MYIALKWAIPLELIYVHEFIKFDLGMNLVGEQLKQIPFLSISYGSCWGFLVFAQIFLPVETMSFSYSINK